MRQLKTAIDSEFGHQHDSSNETYGANASHPKPRNSGRLARRVEPVDALLALTTDNHTIGELPMMPRSSVELHRVAIGPQRGLNDMTQLDRHETDKGDIPPLRNDPMSYPHAILDQLPVMATMIDMRTHEILYVSRQTKKIFGDVVGKTCWRVLQKDQHGPCPFCSDKQLVDRHGLPSGSYRRQTKNTLTQRWYDVTDSAVMADDGRLVKIGIAMDITDQLQSKQSRPPGKVRQAAESLDAERMIVMCACCQNIRTHAGDWLSPAHYLKDEMNLLVSHGMCKSCAKRFYPGFGCGDQKETQSED